MRICVYSDHAEDQMVRRSRTGIIQMVNIPLISWNYKKIGSIQEATFYSEFPAMKMAWSPNACRDTDYE
jgi:aromatic ring-cleaving dioxygenase